MGDAERRQVRREKTPGQLQNEQGNSQGTGMTQETQDWEKKHFLLRRREGSAQHRVFRYSLCAETSVSPLTCETGVAGINPPHRMRELGRPTESLQMIIIKAPRCTSAVSGSISFIVERGFPT